MNTEPTPFLVIEDFLPEADRQRLLDFVHQEDRFQPAQVTAPGSYRGSANEEFRRASVADAEQELFDLVESKLRPILPHARREIGVPYFSPGGLIERQITAHRHGDFFGPHNDHGDPWSESRSRRVSFVYYFHDRPRSFEGGELRLYDRVVNPDGGIGIADTFTTVEPLDNSVVFFPSHVHHEVRPVRAVDDPSAPGATRFTVNGWFHDPGHVRADPPLDPQVRTALTQRYTPSFTETGFEKVKTPPAIHRALRAVYDERVATGTPESIDEIFLPTGAPDFVYIDDVKAQFQLALQQIHEDWSGVELVPTAAYGLRVYRAGHTLIPHTDVLTTHVISSIVHIAHDTVEPWPLWITDLQGNEHYVELDEGEMLLYESARCPHARPVPLNGTAYCSLFLHYRPVDWNVTYWSLLEQAQADDYRDALPPELWPATEPATGD